MQGMPLHGLIWVGVAVAMFAVGRWRDRAERARRALAGLPQKRLAEKQDGDRVVVSGVVSSAAQPLRSPLTGRPCIGYRFTILEDFSPGMDLDSCGKFAINAEGAEAVVQGAVVLSLETTPIPAAECPGLENLQRKRGARNIQCAEVLLRAGDAVSVAGVVSVEIDQAGRRESARGQPIKRTIRGREEDPVVVGPPPER
jgi:hypothetical protein